MNKRTLLKLVKAHADRAELKRKAAVSRGDNVRAIKRWNRVATDFHKLAAELKAIA